MYKIKNLDQFDNLYPNITESQLDSLQQFRIRCLNENFYFEKYMKEIK